MRNPDDDRFRGCTRAGCGENPYEKENKKKTGNEKIKNKEENKEEDVFEKMDNL